MSQHDGKRIPVTPIYLWRKENKEDKIGQPFLTLKVKLKKF